MIKIVITKIRVGIIRAIMIAEVIVKVYNMISFYSWL